MDIRGILDNLLSESLSGSPDFHKTRYHYMKAYIMCTVLLSGNEAIMNGIDLHNCLHPWIYNLISTFLGKWDEM